MIIDIHNHILYGVDDGARDIEDSLELLKEAKAQGIEQMICTPHYRRGMFRYDVEAVHRHFDLLKPQAEALGVDIYLGCEYHVDDDILDNIEDGRVETLAGGDYVLTEYSYKTEYKYIKDYTRELISDGYTPVIAHIERYQALEDIKRVEELSGFGALIQVNSDTILGRVSANDKKYAKRLLKEGLIDVVASDAHDMDERKITMEESYRYVAKKYGEAMADRIYYRNPLKILIG